jgi:hypothetical protein
MLGIAKDSAAVLRAAADYLEREPTAIPYGRWSVPGALTEGNARVTTPMLAAAAELAGLVREIRLDRLAARLRTEAAAAGQRADVIDLSGWSAADLASLSDLLEDGRG